MTPTDPLVEAIVAGVVERLRVTAPKTSRLLDVDAAAEYLGRTPKAVRKLIEDGKIPVVRFDSRVQIDRQDLDRVIEEAKDRAI
jgi:excisionase family DNA binding protein